MTVDQLLAAFRSDLHDEVTPYFWSDADLVRYLNSAVQEACERAKLIEDRFTPVVCSIPLVPGQATYDLHASVLEVKRMTVRGQVIDETSVEDLDCESPGWESRTGKPRFFVFIPATGAKAPCMRVVPTPTVADTLSLIVYRGPLKQLSEDRQSDRPEIPARFHEDLRHWVYRCAYLKSDADSFDKVKALEYEALFISVFGERPDANVQRKRSDRAPPLVRSSW